MRKENLNRLNSVAAVSKSNYSYLLWKYQLKEVICILKENVRGRILDVGCGNKPFEKYLESMVTEYIGCDVVQSSLQKVDVVCDATDIPFENECFDSIISTQVLEHISETDLCLQEMYRLLVKGGILILTVPFVWPIHEEPYDYYRFTEHGLRFKLERVGFKNMKIKATGGLWISLGLMFLSFGCRNINKKTNVLCLFFLRIYNKVFLLIFNNIFSFLNRLFPCKRIPSNYIVIAKKL